MTWRGYSLLVLVLALLYAVWHFVQGVNTPPAPFSSAILDIVQHPDRVRIQRLKPLVGTTPAPHAAFFDGASLVGTGRAIEPTADWVRRFTGLVADGKTFSGASKTCTPHPSIVVRFVRDERRIDVMLDFDCDQVLVQDDGKASGVGNVGSFRADFVKLSKQVFPDDPEITGLIE